MDVLCPKCGKEIKKLKPRDEFCSAKCELEHALRTPEEQLKALEKG